MRAYECVLAAKILHHRSRAEDNQEAQRLIERAISLDPKYAHAHAWRACIVGQSWIYNWCPDRSKAEETIVSELGIALSLDENDSDVHRILAAVNLNYNDHETASYHQERALTLNPNNDLIVVQNGEILTWRGKPEEGIEWIKKAMLLNPHHPERFWYHLGRAYFSARRYGEVVEALRRLSKPDQFQHAFLAASYAMMGNDEAAQNHARSVLALDPSFDVEKYMATLHYEKAADIEHHRGALLKAGLPAGQPEG
jgi:adenylate cyclase